MSNKSGFTLIELIVTIAVIAILAGALMVLINPAKILANARDAGRMSDAKQLQGAIERYMVETGSAPINRVPGSGYCSNSANFLQELIDTKQIKQMPKDPSGGTYCYYDYGPGSIGALVVVYLEGIADTTVAPKGSCRPFAGNWCSSTIASKYFCLCLPY